MDAISLLTTSVFAGALGLTVLFWITRHYLGQASATRKFRRLQLAQGAPPPSLHPVIDASACTGCMACIRACPEGDILGMVDGAAKLIEPGSCIGHGRCADACPTEAIKLVFGSSERGVDLPLLHPGFETNRPGVHVVGELGGMGLIRNAVLQGLEVVEFIERALEPSRAPEPAYDIAIVGAGPAGLATAVACRAAELSFCVFEQDSVGGTIANYPRQKVVMTETVKLPLFGAFGKKRMSKEGLLETWQEIIKRFGIEVHERVRVEDIKGRDGAFEVETTRGQVRARKVVLALGRRGTPRRLGVAGEELPKVTYRLADPLQYAGAKVAVIGGGDAAVEAAVALVRVTDAEVTIVHRGGDFSRCKRDNVAAINELTGTGSIRAHYHSRVEGILPARLTIVGEAEVRQSFANDFVIICAGGDAPTAFLSRLGLAVSTHFGTDAQPTPHKTVISDKVERARHRQALTIVLGLLGAAVVAFLAMKGRTYYALPRDLRAGHPLHAALRASGPWGHGIGVAATGVMLLNFLYSVRKRGALFGGFGALRSWLTVHMFVGVFTPLVIAFHAAFQSNNLLATGTAASLAVVVGTGLVGRFLIGLLPENGGRPTRFNVRGVLTVWRVLHVVLSVFLVVIIAGHIGMSIYLGYRWVF